ncbi:hypothetical protein HAX54_001427 [Datura stramonium]|uniref:Uncharacterized protein n=1 Tax=Datura stramonium TaxID=4076 RepID=A0ABS8WQQ9_DATST|nr:hypothetical protein [Datura stramonium]
MTSSSKLHLGTPALHLPNAGGDMQSAGLDPQLIGVVQVGGNGLKPQSTPVPQPAFHKTRPATRRCREVEVIGGFNGEDECAGKWCHGEDGGVID